jgi:hypothetical protein
VSEQKIASCSLCGQEIFEKDRRMMHKQIVGWEKPGRGATGKSGSSIILRRYTGAVAHSDCVERKRRGVAPKQQGLF